MKIKKNDKVRVIAGNSKGAEGTVLQVIVDNSGKGNHRVVVEGVNLVKKHQKPTQLNQTGGIIEKEAPLHISNVMLVSPHTDEATRVSVKIAEDGSKQRICKKSNKPL